MRNYVIINGVNSLTIQGLAINNLPPITKPMIRTQREEIDGRDGDIVTELGYSAYDKQMEIGLYGNFDIDEIIKYFTGEGTIVFSNEADKYYNFKILDQIDYEKLLKFKTATITLHCQPFKYPLEEEPVEAEITTLTGAGETITLNNTEEAPMKIDLKGNTSQDTTTGKNKLNLPNGTYTDFSVTNTTTNGKVVSSGTFSGAGSVLIATLNPTYTIQANDYLYLFNDKTPTGTVQIFGKDNNGTMLFAQTINSTNFKINLNQYAGSSLKDIYFYGTNGAKMGITCYLMIAQGSSETSWESYTGGIPAPNPDYPQDIHVVSGDNIIIVSNSDNTQSQSYPINLGNIELCKIGDYQDVIKKSTGKNLLKLNDIAETTSNGITYSCTNGEIRLNGTATSGVIIDFESFYLPSGNYYLSRNLTGTTSGSWQNYLRNASTSIKQGEGTFTTNGENVFFRLYFNSGVVLNNVVLKPMLNEGSTALPYEPYGTGWYLKKETGRFYSNSTTGWYYDNNHRYYRLIDNIVVPPNTDTVGQGFCNVRLVTANQTLQTSTTPGLAIHPLSRLYISESVYNNISTTPTLLYYALATPTYTEITDSTLLSQLNALARSYTSQTNISQVNNDLPFELDVSVTFVVPMEINNIGNTYAKPILTIEGTGNIGVVLNDIQILEIDLTNNGKIAIDVTKLEAYNPDDDTLLNRLVTGDYMKLLINEGDNKITFTGEVSGATLTNYIRWI